MCTHVHVCVKGKGMYTWYSATSWIITSEVLRCGTCSQGISQLFLHTHTFIRSQNEPYLRVCICQLGVWVYTEKNAELRELMELIGLEPAASLMIQKARLRLSLMCDCVCSCATQLTTRVSRKSAVISVCQSRDIRASRVHVRMCTISWDIHWIVAAYGALSRVFLLLLVNINVSAAVYNYIKTSHLYRFISVLLMIQNLTMWVCVGSICEASVE